MTASGRLGVVLGLLALGACLAGAGCFDPRRPGCAFSCVADRRCPEGYVCGNDGLCHREDGKGTCDLPPQIDGSADGRPDAPLDGPRDAPADGGQDGPEDGPQNGSADGPADGAADGPVDGAQDGPADAAADVTPEGGPDSVSDGASGPSPDGAAPG